MKNVFFDRLRFSRTLLGLNQAEMGSKVGVPQTSYSNYERGRELPITVLEKFDLVGISSEWLTTGRIRASECDLVKEMLKQSKLQVSEFAEKTGVSVQFFNAVVEGQIEPSYYYIEQACKLAGVEPPSADVWKTVDGKVVRKTYVLIDEPETESERISELEEMVEIMKNSIKNLNAKITVLQDKLISAMEENDELKKALKKYEK